MHTANRVEPDDDVIVHKDADAGTGASDTLGDLKIMVAWCGWTVRVIVNEDQGCRTDLEGDADDLSRMRLDGVDRTDPQDTVANQTISAVEVENTEMFPAERRHVVPQIGHKRLGRADQPSVDRIERECRQKRARDTAQEPLDRRWQRAVAMRRIGERAEQRSRRPVAAQQIVGDHGRPRAGHVVDQLDQRGEGGCFGRIRWRPRTVATIRMRSWG